MAFTRDAARATVWISIALGGLAAAAPAGIGPIATGYIVSLTGWFCGAFLMAGVVLLISIFAYVALLDEITPLPDREPSLAHDIAGAH